MMTSSFLVSYLFAMARRTQVVNVFLLFVCCDARP